MHQTKTRRGTAALTMSLILAPTTVGAYDVNEQIAINGLLAWAGQCQEVSGATNAHNLCRGGLPFRPEVFYNPTKQDQFFVKFEFAAGNGLNEVSPFVLKPWNAPLEANVRHINGGDRSYLLEAWYAHTFRFSATNRVQITGGILDAGSYINENAFANSEYTQFMNEVFVNSHNAFIPAYDWGGALVWKIDQWTLSGLGMNVAKNDAGHNFNWYALEADYNLKIWLGEGNYRLMYIGASRAFPAPAAQSDPSTGLDQPPTGLKTRSGWALSCDQELGKVVGVFLRLARQIDAALVDYRNEYSGGLDFKGAGWGREGDNIGIGLALLDGGNAAIARTQVFEGYYRLPVHKYLALTADVQYMQDRYRSGADVAGWIWGLRAVSEF